MKMIKTASDALKSRAAAPFYIVILVWILYPYLVAYAHLPLIPKRASWGLLGTYGDSFGALNTLFSGLALAGLALNIYLQNSQINKIETREQNIQSEQIRLSLYNRRFQVYDRTVRFVLLLVENDETFVKQRSLEIQQNFIIAYRESRFLFGMKSEIFKTLKKVNDDSYNIVWHREALAANPNYKFSQKEKDDFEEQTEYLNGLLPKLEDHFSDYLDFSKIGIISK